MICLATQAIRKFHENRLLANFFRGARAAVIGMILEAGLSIGKSSLIDIKTVFIAGIALISLLKYKLNPIWILLGAGIVGLVS